MITLDSKDNITYISSGLFKSDKEWIHPKRIIDSFEIIIMYEGEAFIAEEDKEFILRKNDVLFLEPGKEHFGYKTSTAPVSFFWLHYNTDCEKYKSLPKFFNISDPYALKTLCSQLLHVANTPTYDRVSSELFCALISEEIISKSKTEDLPGNRLAIQIKEWIRINLDKPLTVKKIATHFGYHENHIARVFKSAFDTGIKEYITEIKLKAAKDMLCTTLYTIKQVAHSFGFESENHFIKFFKYHTGMTPTECRNIHINTHINNS